MVIVAKVTPNNIENDVLQLPLTNDPVSLTPSVSTGWLKINTEKLIHQIFPIRKTKTKTKIIVWKIILK